MSSPEENKSLTKEFFKTVFQNHDLNNIDKYMLDSYIQHNPDCPQGMKGFLEFFTSMFKAFPDFKSTINKVVADENLVFAYNTVTGTHSGAKFLDIEPTGNKVDFTAVDIFRFENGKFAEHWDVADTRTFFSQLGVIREV